LEAFVKISRERATRWSGATRPVDLQFYSPDFTIETFEYRPLFRLVANRNAVAASSLGLPIRLP